MLQTLEREPQEDLNNQLYDASPAPGRPPFGLGLSMSFGGVSIKCAYRCGRLVPDKSQFGA
jgi:hypothetical protein